MEYKPRREPIELKKLKVLNVRMTLTDKEKQHLSNLQKGFDGELQFDQLVNQLECECLKVNDLLLNHSNTFQIDSTLIFPGMVNLYEVKNFEGDFHLDSEKLYKHPHSEVMNPMIQLNRTESNLRQLLQSLGISMKVNAYVVFINQEFVLYDAPRQNKQILFHNQLKRHFNSLNASKFSKLARKEHMLAEKLVSLHMEDSPFTQLPAFEWDHLKKGISCEKCSSLLVDASERNCLCMNCGHKETVDAAVMRSVQEIKLLFPNLKITTALVHEWCHGIDSKLRINRILHKHLKIVKLSRWSYYE